MNNKRNKWIQCLLWMIQGCLVGIGAILPGVSGGTLCYIFGIYAPLLEVLSHPITGVKKHWFMLIFVGLGGALGFVGFAGITEALLAWNEAVVLCVFVGLILGTLPALWRDAGKRGRNKFSFISLALSFLAISALFYALKNLWQITIPSSFGGYLLCGVIWGLSFILPGLSSSTLLLFFGIYENMAAGISTLNFAVLLPLGFGMVATLLLLSRAMEKLFSHFHNVATHTVLGFVVATTLMLLPSFAVSHGMICLYFACMAGGAVASYFFGRLCDSFREKS